MSTRELKRKSKGEWAFPRLMITPTLLVLIIMTAYPLIFTFFYSFTDYNYLKGSYNIIKFDNYISLLKNTYFQQSVFNTIKFTLLAMALEMIIGLLVAARKFDYTLEYRFSTYATKWIRQGVTRCLLNHAGMIRVPLHTAERMRKIDVTRAALRQENGEEPTTAQIAKACGLPESKVTELIALMPEVFSLDIPTGEGEDGGLHTLLEDIQAPQPYEELVRRELEHTMKILLSTLNNRQQRILRLHFGMEDGVSYSLEEIGRMLNISKERVRQIERQAMDKLQKNGESLGLEDFLNE